MGTMKVGTIYASLLIMHILNRSIVAFLHDKHNICRSLLQKSVK